ncbi:hypothetical protein [uncultured Dysosmobacter sp.]|uniref:hypothetical protein n=1 Tax=uncultured Dysosmobacter sp. TaxID=2591384 RepID=UPI0026721AF1|nr:hypothetical protein [uncultured Dysosmobacter sp.]
MEKTVDHNGDCVPQKRGFAGKFVKNDEKEPATFSKNSIFSAICVLKRMTTQDIVLSFFLILRKPIGNDGTIV